MESSVFVTHVLLEIACIVGWNIVGIFGFSKPFDVSMVTWAHAVNSRSALERELEGSVDFIEADISLGYVTGKNYGPPVPIMAHPPITSSDLSLDMFLDSLALRNTSKGIKLDFKFLEVVEPSLKLLQLYAGKLNTTLWLNADILPGPVQPNFPPVEGTSFLSLCRQYFPDAVVSVGWTTDWSPNYPSDTWHYGWDHVKSMADVIRCFGYDKQYPSFTFPVRGIFASRSLKELQWLLGVIPGSTLTVWTGKRDPLRLKDILEVRKAFATNQVYYDVPEPIHSRFMAVVNTSSVDESPSVISADKWTKVTRGSQEPTCLSQTYLSSGSIVFGESLQTAVLYKRLINVNGDQGIKARGKVRFFGNNSPTSNPSEITIVIVDVSLLSKNFSSGSDVAGSDTNVLWKAINSSQLHTFSDGEDRCRMFMLDSSIERSFQAWLVPCDETFDHNSFEETVRNGVPEVPYYKKLVFPEFPFMIGFVSSGENPAVIYDLEITELKGKSSSSHIVSLISEVAFGMCIALFFTFQRKI